MRKAVAIGIMVVYFAVIIEGMVRGGEYSAAVTAMAPALSIAAGYLLGRDVIDIFVQRRRQSERPPDRREGPRGDEA